MVKNLLVKLKIVIVFCDIVSTQYLTKNPILHARTKHVEVDFHYVRELVGKKKLDVKYLCSDDLVADNMTKAMSRFYVLRNKLMIHKRPEFEGE